MRTLRWAAQHTSTPRAAPAAVSRRRMTSTPPLAADLWTAAWHSDTATLAKHHQRRAAHHVGIPEDWMEQAIIHERWDVLEAMAPVLNRHQGSWLWHAAVQRGLTELLTVLAPRAHAQGWVRPDADVRHLIALDPTAPTWLLAVPQDEAALSTMIRNLLYTKDTVLADHILRHPAIPVSVISGVLHYGKSRGLSLPHAHARLSAHELSDTLAACLEGTGEGPDTPRKM